MSPVGSARAATLAKPIVRQPASGVARYRFEQDATDAWNSNDLTDNTSAGYTTDSAVGSYAKALDGTDDWLTNGALDTTALGNVSVSAWINMNTMDFTSIQSIVYLGEDDKPEIFFHFSDVTSSGSPNLRVAVATGSNRDRVYTADDPVSSGTWQMVTYTRGGGGAANLSIYIDGSEVSTTTELDEGVKDSLSMSNLDVSEARGSLDRHLDGDVDDIRVYDKELTATEVSNLYNNGSIN